VSNSVLKDIRVLSCTHLHAGPWCGKILAELGAEVIKIEPPEGEFPRKMIPLMYRGENYFVMQFSDSKKFITLNLKNEKGRKIFLDLVKVSDVFLESYTPGTLDRLGVGYETQRAANPRIIYASISGYGYTGPSKDLPGQDYLAQARSGIMSVTGFPRSPPVLSAHGITDHISAIYTALAILAAIRYRDRTGRGQRIDMSLFDAAVDFLTEYSIRYVAEDVPPTRNGNRGIFGGCNMYKAKDGCVFIYYILAWNQLLKAIGKEDLIDNPDYTTFDILSNPKVDEMIQDWVGTKTRKEAVEQMNKEGVVCAPVQNIDEMFRDPQVLARELFVDVEHPRIGKVKIPRTPLNLSETPSKIRWLDSGLGCNNKEVFGSILKYSEEEIAKLQDEGVI
jgi:crotonobetainyl-CoA:carnitine CoA-transferase CaiB-like acyl-CoA transferase